MDPQTSEMVAMIVVMPTMFLFIAWIIKIIWDHKRIRLKSDLHHKLVEKFSNVQELNKFLQSETGSGFLKSLTIEGLAPKERLLSSVTKGIVLIFLGLAVFLLGFIILEHPRAFHGVGVVVFMLGVGFLVAAGVSFNISKKWGIIEREQ